MENDYAPSKEGERAASKSGNSVPKQPDSPQRRRLLKGAAAAGVVVAGAGSAAAGLSQSSRDALGSFLQDHYRRMDRQEIQEALARIERRAERDHGVAIRCGNQPPIAGVAFGYALNLSRCTGTRRCVDACIRENNTGRHDGLGNIRVLSMPDNTWDLSRADHHYQPETVPEKGRWYLPVQCQQCGDPACVQACPVEATWREPDGMVVVDYDWCIGCRYCATACPYWARRFNWRDPVIPKGEITPDTHYLGNRPRRRGVMEKCTLCVQRSRRGSYPACHQACPTGARIFGNLLDADSPIRYVLEHKRVYRLKEEQGTDPQFWYVVDGP
ncbi:MAG: 4Fe-4S dicluster domain-containing protein [Magnetococcales bacterium]|nr:4Fe-4S dicluster domain-containing protein [Magnetococcales bacterium]